ncbi:MAG TPA: hypothetical protein VFQ60_00890, partial [Patescibacteria group bacterium]|nr:hypothetical protein [Patescibacteria group bacterium]
MPVESPNLLTCPGVPELPEPPSASEPMLPPGEPVPLLPSKAKRFGWWIFLVLVILILIAISPLVYGATRAGMAVQRVKQDAAKAQASLLNKDFAGAQAAIADTDTALMEVRLGLGAMGPWKIIPYVREQLQILDDTASAAESALKGVQDVISAVAQIQQAMDVAGTADALNTGIAPNRSFKDLSPEEKRTVLARFNEVLPELHVAREKFKIALDAWQRIPQDELYA